MEALPTSRPPRRLVDHLPDLLLLGALLVAGLRFLAPIERLMDLNLYDESIYLYNGATLLRNGLPTPDWAPLYAVWYFGLSLIQPDRIALYFVNYRLLCLLLPLLLYLTLRRYRVPPAPAAICAFLLLIAEANSAMWPRVSHFALLIILGSLLAAGAARSRTSALALAGFGALLAAYARPELSLAAALIALATLATLARSAAARRSANWPLLGGLALAALALIAGLRPPIGDGYRSFAAFSQHFSLNWVGWTGSTLSPWTNAPAIMATAFGDAQSIGGAMLAGPDLFTRHLLSNAARFPQTLFELFFLHANLLLPAGWQAAEGWLLLLLSLGCALVAGWRGRGLLRERLRALTPLWITLGSYLPGLLITTLVIYPRNHYMLILGMILLVGAMAPFGHPARPLTPRGLLIGLTLAAAMIIFTPRAETVLTFPETKATINTIRFIASLQIAAPVQLLEAEGGYHIYLGDQFSRVAEYEKNGGFSQFAAERRINMIVVSNALRNDSRLRDDPAWQRLLADPAAQGYAQLAIPTTERLLLVEQGLLTQRSLWPSPSPPSAPTPPTPAR